jgi:hypothetical protein
LHCGLHRRGGEPAGDGASGLAARDQAGIGQDVEMLHDRRQRYRERRSQRADREVGPLGKPHDQRAPRRVGERSEGAIERAALNLNHLVKYSGGRSDVKRATQGGRRPRRRHAAVTALTAKKAIVTLVGNFWQRRWH